MVSPSLSLLLQFMNYSHKDVVADKSKKKSNKLINCDRDAEIICVPEKSGLIDLDTVSNGSLTLCFNMECVKIYELTC